MVDVEDGEDLVSTKRSDYMQAPCRESVKTCFCFKCAESILPSMRRGRGGRCGRRGRGVN